MSISPVQGIDAVNEAQLAEANLAPRPSRSSAEEGNARDPEAGTSPSQEVRAPQNASVPLEMPQDEVQVQREGQGEDEIVIKYLDPSGNLILQVPSSQVLGVARAIDEDLEQQAKARAASDSQAAGEGSKTHGH